MARRGGNQRIPRPPTARAGGPAPWAHLAPDGRRPTIDDIRRCCAGLPPARPAVPVVPDARAAAVLVPLFEAGGEAHVILTKRPESLPSHQGEIAFPGGKALPGEHPIRTALREAHEEIGLEPGHVAVLAQLDGLATVGSRFSITPFVGVVDDRPRLAPDPAEVDTVLEVPLSDLLADGVFREERWDTWQPDRAVYFFDLPDETVWGATARILTAFLTALVAGR